MTIRCSLLLCKVKLVGCVLVVLEKISLGHDGRKLDVDCSDTMKRDLRH